MNYYIYHIPGIKIGCTSVLQRRINEQGFSNYEILETHSCIYEASYREIQLQKDYGLPVDKVLYYKMVEHNINRTAESRAKRKATMIANGTLGNGGKIGGYRGKNIPILAKDQVREIKSKFVKRVYTQSMLAKEYNVSKTTIRRALANE